MIISCNKNAKYGNTSLVILFCAVFSVASCAYSRTTYKSIDYYFGGLLFTEADTFRKVSPYSVEEVFSQLLERLEEPSLLDRATSIYRFTWARSFHDNMTFRLEVDNDEIGSLHVKSINVIDVDENGGDLKIDTVIPVSKKDISEFLKLIDKMNFWAMQKVVKLPGVPLDGADWLLEGIKGKKYNAVYRWSPKEGDFREAALYLVGISGLDVGNVY